jgi:acetyl-CoA acetyltransferase
MENNPAIEVNRYLGGGDLTFFGRTHYGGGAACATVLQAALAVSSGLADTVVCYRAMNERSMQRFGAGVQDRPPLPTTESAHFGWYAPFGLLTPASWVALAARRYMHAYGATSEDFGRVSVADRRHAATNPAAWFHGQPITLADHQRSRFIVEPLRLLDCCQESDGAVAVVVTSLERARDLRQPPAVIAAAAQGASHEQQMMTGYYADQITGLPEMGLVARQLWAQSGLSPADIQTAVIYDHFTPFVLVQLEEFGFCPRGEAKEFLRDGHIELGGRLPINTHGGQLGEAYIHGMNGIAEGVRQVRGTAVNPVKDVEHVVVTAGTGVPTSGLILGVDAR